MKVQLEKTFPMPAGADLVWAFLQDIEAVAGCMPGAKITERIDERHYKGTVAVRFGPALMSFRGEVEVKDIDAVTRSLHLTGKGTDTSGTSGASMDLTARIEGAGTASKLVGGSEVSMSGKAAAFGGRMISAVAEQVLQQFAGNFAAQVAARAEHPPSDGGGSVQSARLESSVAGATAPAGGAGEAPAAAAGPKARRELNGLSLLWAVFKTWVRALLGKNPA